MTSKSHSEINWPLENRFLCMTTNRRNVWPLLKACFLWYWHYVWIADRYILSPHTASHSKYQIEMTWLLRAIFTKIKEEIMKKNLRDLGTRNAILNENFAINNIFVWNYNPRSISNFQNLNMYTESK